MKSTLDSALYYLNRWGMRAIPIHHPLENGACSCGRECSTVGKHPVPSKWNSLETPMGEKELRFWFGKDQSFNVGVCTGEQSGGLLYLDIDTHKEDQNGFKSLEAIEAKHGKLPVTLTQKTGGGGEGRFFRLEAQDLARIKNKAGKASIAPGLDLRVSGGQTVVPPSLHSSGRRYEWVEYTAPIAEAPRWFVDLCIAESEKTSEPTPAPAPLRQPSSSDSAIRKYCLAALESARNKVLETRDGSRNNELNNQAVAVGSLIQQGGLYLEEATASLVHAATMIGLPAHEAAATVRSGISAGMKKPRDLSSVLEKKPAAKTLKIDERINPRNDIDEMFLEATNQGAGKMISVETPWRTLNMLSDCLRPATVCVLSGPTKVGKSYFIMNLICGIHSQGITWKYLPLEDDRKQWGWRMLAILEGNYAVTSTKQEDAEIRKEALMRHYEMLETYMKNVSENPRVGVVDSSGKTVVPELPYQQVCEWASEAVKAARVVVIDPLAQIDFSGRDIAREESALVRNLLGCVAGKESTIILITHVVKRPGHSAAVQLSADDVQGAVNLTRLPQTTLILDAHDIREGEVRRAGGLTQKVMHNRTLLIAAARNAGGTRSRIAFNQSAEQPHFEELGVLKGGKVGKK